MTIGHEELAAQAKTMRDAADTIQSVVGWINKLERRLDLSIDTAYPPAILPVDQFQRSSQ